MHQLQTPQAQNNSSSQGMLLLATRPQNYESLSLTNSTEFGQHSLQSSVELSGRGPNTVLQSSGAKPLPKLGPSTASNFLANQGAARSNSKEKDSKPGYEEKDWKLPFQNNTILEDLKEEDVSFAHSNHRLNNSRIQSQNESKNKIERQASANNSSEAVRSELTDRVESKTSAQRKNELSYKDDELIEELARTCFKSGGFYKPNANSHLEVADKLEVDHNVDQIKSNSDTEERKDEVAQRERDQAKETRELPSVHTPDMLTKKFSTQANDLIKIDESQFVTLSQVQENRAVMSSGVSQSPYRTSKYTTTGQEQSMGSDASAVTQERMNKVPSSAISDTDREYRVQAMSTHSNVSN